MVYAMFFHKRIMLVVLTLTEILQVLVAQFLQFYHVGQDVRPETAARQVLDNALCVPFANTDFIGVGLYWLYRFPEFFTRYAPPPCSATFLKLAYPAITGDKHSLTFLVTVSHSDNKIVVLGFAD
jgi:hypothetical protein